MSLKLARLNEWFPLPEAAQYCAKLLQEDVTTAALRSLIIQNRLTASVYLEGEFYAVTGRVLSNQAYLELRQRRGERQPVTPFPKFVEHGGRLVPELTPWQPEENLVPEGQSGSIDHTRIREGGPTDDPMFFSHELLPDRSGMLEFNLDTLEPITGVWDLSMVGMESSVIREAWRSDPELTPIPYRCLNGILLKDPIKNRWARLFDTSLTDAFTAACDLPKHQLIVIRRDELHRVLDAAHNAADNVSKTLPRAELPSRLEAVNLAYQRWWKNANRNNREDCPKKEDVKAWLMEQGLSAKLADAGATIIKPDWATDKGW